MHFPVKVWVECFGQLPWVCVVCMYDICPVNLTALTGKHKKEQECFPFEAILEVHADKS